MTDNYPPGVTAKDFDEPPAIDCDECHGTGEIKEWNEEEKFNEVTSCKNCNGKGYIITEEDDE